MTSRRSPVLLLVAAMALPPTGALGATTPHGNGDSRDTVASGMIPAQYHPSLVLTSTGTATHFKATATADTFYLYGGPGTNEGKFQDEFNGPGVLGHAPHAILPGEWFGVDLTEQQPLWQIAPNASVTDAEIIGCIESLNSHGSGNHAAWAGRSSTQEPDWASGSGYGNNWNAFLNYEKTVTDPGVGQTVGLSFAFHHDTEPSYDFFNVEYDSFNTTIVVYRIDGNDAPFAAPGVQYPADVSARSITYDANGYAGPNHDEIRIRLVAASDGAWSDEDGKWPTTCGHTMVDDITVTTNEGSTFDDFENTIWPYANWAPQRAPFAGDFAKIFPRFHDIDPCLEDHTPVATFIDDGTPPSNDLNQPPYQDPPLSTGGSLSANWDYGVPGGWVVNATGGLSHGVVDLTNTVWSPPIAWDLPGTADDDIALRGATLRFSVWRHLPLLNSLFYVWNVRSSNDGGSTWSDWANHNLVYYGPTPEWLNTNLDVTDLLVENPTHVQIELGVWNIFCWECPDNDATPSPVFDNVALQKYRLSGPVITARTIDLLQDSFPQSGNADFETLAGRQNSDVQLDMAQDVSSGNANIPGDSVVVDVAARISGTTVDQIALTWILDKNPWFDDVRVMPPGTSVIPGGARNGWDQWSGMVDADSVRVPRGQLIENRYFFDLPDADFLHPGDVLRYYVWASDSDGRISTCPAELEGFDTGRTANYGLYDPRFTVHALPAHISDGQSGSRQPWILVVNDLGFRGGFDEIYQAFQQNGARRGHLEWDMYTTWGPTSGVSNGIGSAGAHGATPQQLAGYETILYFAGNLGSTLLSDGSNLGNNDKGDDLGVVTSWFQADADRYIAHFGDNIASALLDDSPGPGGTYVTNVMGVTLNGRDVKDAIDGQSAPLVVPAPGSPCLETEFLVFGGCPHPNEFDDISPGVGAAQSHFFLDPGGSPYPEDGTRAASVTHAFLDGNQNEKISITFPYGFASVWNESGSTRAGPNPPGGPDSQRARLLKEIVEDCFRQARLGDGPVAVHDGATLHGIHSLASFPNPFNPATTIAFDLGTKSRVTVKIYNLRGQLVTKLADAVMDAGPVRFVWHGKDDAGQTVASGVYLVEVENEGASTVEKIALLR